MPRPKKDLPKESTKNGLWKTKWLEEFARTGTKTSACANADICQTTYYYALKHDEDFANAVARLEKFRYDSVVDALEEKGFEIALDGENWQAVKFFLEKLKPETYAKQQKTFLPNFVVTYAHQDLTTKEDTSMIEGQMEELEDESDFDTVEET